MRKQEKEFDDNIKKDIYYYNKLKTSKYWNKIRKNVSELRKEGDRPSSPKNVDEFELIRERLLSAIAIAAESELRAYEQVRESFRSAHDGSLVESKAVGLPAVAPALWMDRKTGREVSPADFVRATYAQWLDQGMERSDLASLDFPLYQAFSKWVRRHPEDEALLPKKRSPTESLSAEESVEYQRERAVKKRKAYVARKMSISGNGQ